MNDLVYVIKRSNLSAYAEDTQIFFGDKDPLIVQESRNSDLSYVDKWFLEKGMKRNHSEYQAMVMGHKKIATNHPHHLLGVDDDRIFRYA